MRVDALRAPRDGFQDSPDHDAVPAAADDERAVEPPAGPGELRMGHRADPRPRVPRLELEYEPVPAEPMPALERELARWIDPRDVEARQRLVPLPLEPGAPPIVAREDLGQTARPRAVERVLERARERRPDLGGRGARGDLVRVEERDRRRIAGQAASTTTVAP